MADVLAVFSNEKSSSDPRTVNLITTSGTTVGSYRPDFKGKTFLVALDYYSRYLEVMELSRPTSFLVIAKLKSIFTRWGILLEVVSDNGPQFSSESFSNFTQSYGFKHTTSSLYYPQSNGLAESAVKIAS